jgi:serine/threonine protein kinase
MLLYKTCGKHGLIPRAYKIAASYDRAESALCGGGYGDVWKGKYHGRDVAVKVLRTFSTDLLQRTVKVGLRTCPISALHFKQTTCLSAQRFAKEVVTWKLLRHPNVVPFMGVMESEDRFGMVSKWMKNGSINDFVKAHPEANRFTLVGPRLDTPTFLTSMTIETIQLEGVATGLIYLHSSGMVHGDLKGVRLSPPRLLYYHLQSCLSRKTY